MGAEPRTMPEAGRTDGGASDEDTNLLLPAEEIYVGCSKSRLQARSVLSWSLRSQNG